MNINEVKTSFKIADVIFVPNSTTLTFSYLNPLIDENGVRLPRGFLSTNYARVYLIVVNGIIKKIGSSQSNGGIRSTLNIYRDGGVAGRPSIRSYGVWYFLYSEAIKGSKIEFYLIYHSPFSYKVKGLFGLHEVPEAFIHCKLIEQCCIADYLSVENAHPDWNLQEQGADWPQEVKEEHAQLTQRSTTRAGRRPRTRGND
jgi:hypothetical protein